MKNLETLSLYDKYYECQLDCLYDQKEELLNFMKFSFFALFMTHKSARGTTSIGNLQT